MTRLALLFILFFASRAWVALDEERALLHRDPAKAASRLSERLVNHPDDPWLLYNAGVAAYAAKDYSRADELWQRLSTLELPEALRGQVWLQMGNVSYRVAQPQIEKEPDVAVGRLEQSREAFRVALAFKQGKMAEQNLHFVEAELEKVYARLAQRLAGEAKKENSVAKAVEKLEAALTYAQQAQSLNEKSQLRQQERREIEKALGGRLDERASREEKAADQRNVENPWERRDAQERLQNALSDFQQAQALDAGDEVARAGEMRVEEKLANLFDRAGRKDQQDARQLAQNRPQQAVEKYEQALDNFQEALGIKPDHRDAMAGEKEVREELEKLHIDEGDKLANQGEQQIQRSPAQAAENLLHALDNFRSAQALDSQNPEIQPRIDKVEAMLPDLLTRLGQQQQQQGERAEQRKQAENAVNNYERAEESFARAQSMAPDNEAARRGQQEAQDALARLRQQLAEKSEEQAQQPQQSKSQQQSEQSFQSMLAELKEEMKDREVHARHHSGQKYNEERDRNLRNW